MIRSALLGVLLTIAVPATGEDAVARIDLRGEAIEASVVAASISELLGHRQLLADDLLDTGAGKRSLHLTLVAADAEAAAQAVAHALQTWWAPLPGGGARYSGAVVLPVMGPVTVRTYPSRLRGRPRLEQQVRELMAPWLDGERGLVLHPPLGRWTATLDAAGHRELERLLVRIERPQIRIPPLIPHRAQPAAHLHLQQRLEAPDAPDLAAQLASRLGRSVALATGELPSGPFVLHPAPLLELPLQLEAQGLPAAWVAGVLCLGGRPEDRLHPALRRHWATVPVQHLAPDPLALGALVARLQQDAAPRWWRLPGAGILPLEDNGMLLMAADHSALGAVMHHLERVDRDGGIDP